MKDKCFTQIYHLLSETYAAFEKTDDAWGANMPFKALSSLVISAMTQSVNKLNKEN